MEGGPSDRIRTCGILLPKQARYQLRYTRLLSLFIRLVVFSQSKRATNCANPGYEIQTDPTAGCSNSRVCLQNDYTTEPDRSTRGLPQKDGMQTKDYPLFY